MATWGWLLFGVSVRCHLIQQQYIYTSERSKTGVEIGNLFQTLTLVQCAFLCSVKKKSCFSFEKGTGLCNLDSKSCNYFTEMAEAGNKNTHIFLALKEDNGFTFSLHTLSNNSNMSVVSKKTLLSVKGVVTDVHYHVKTHTIYWITERNAKKIYTRKIGDSKNHVKRWPNPKYGVLEFAIDNTNNCFLILNKYRMNKSYNFVQMHRLPVTLQAMRNEDNMAIDPHNRRVFYTQMTADKKRVALRYISYGETSHTGIVYLSKDNIKSFVLDPVGLYAFVCKKRLTRISFKERKTDNFVTSPPRSSCSVMASNNRHVYNMVETHGGLSVEVLSMETGSVVAMTKLFNDKTLTGGHIEVLDM